MVSLSGDLPDVVVTTRLRLELIGADEGRAMLAGHREPTWHPEYPRREDLDAVSMIPAGGSTWSARHVVRAFDSLVVGTIGFFGPPATEPDGVEETEIGFGLVAEARGHGAATEAVRALLLQADRAGVRVRARVRPENKASVRVLAKCGFTSLRSADDDGNLVLGRPLPTPTGLDR